MPRGRWLGAAWGVLALVLALGGCRHEVEVEERRVKTFELGTDPITLEVRADDGEVRIQGYDDLASVTVTARLRARAPTRQDAQRALAAVPLSMIQSEGRVQISLEPPSGAEEFLYPQGHEIDLDIAVPRHTHLRVTVDNGNVIVREWMAGYGWSATTANWRSRAFQAS